MKTEGAEKGRKEGGEGTRGEECPERGSGRWVGGE